MKSTKTATTEQIAQIVFSKNNIALFAHTRPDGDAVGACVALCLALRKQGKTVSMFCDTPMPAPLKKFPHSLEFSDKFSGKFDLLVSLDSGDLSRLGELSYPFSCYKGTTVNVDHHGNEMFCTYNCVDRKAASTCQIVYDILQKAKVEIDHEIATYLYIGLCTDTGNFQNANVDSAAYRMAADMYDYGAGVLRINRIFFQDTTVAITKVWGKAMSRIRTYFDGKLALIYVTADELAEFGLDSTDTEGIVREASNIETAVAAVSLCEHAPNSFKVSMRGKSGFDVRDICRQFGGNGHLAAAGCIINGFLEDVIERIVRVFGFVLEQ